MNRKWRGRRNPSRHKRVLNRPARAAPRRGATKGGSAAGHGFEKPWPAPNSNPRRQSRTQRRQCVVLNSITVSSLTPQADLQVAEGENLRHRCRNPQCRAKLPASVTNARAAFCCCGCYTSFFRTRCRVCEQPIEQPARGGTRLICKRAKCKSAWRAGLGFGRYHHSISAKSIQEVPVNKGPKVGISDDRASWRVIATGAPISASQYHCAIVGAAEAIAAADRSNAAHWARSSGRRPHA